MKAKKQKTPILFDIRRRSDGVKVAGPFHAYTADQVVGFYVKIQLQKPWDKHKYYATECSSKEKEVAKKKRKGKIKRLVEISGACPRCGYVDPQKDQATQCPNCEHTGSS
ncbi:hypothetical protein GW933_04400 [Candidatus Falkowbacteria bacterium]|uniref:Uncharacterized protein n=1 Tax=Candidatus Buchananbacteria bacterium CG10_big_fil_rev_8_21_14_0_10_33_19 TaxID=1974525 RepID=A0A2H0W571_9BACT|nr:hypothetical protein [Candidatus Falkowbacteria bacterium]PIS06427.1 MAG: hypothetical protein COT80_00590 [Candidatus Buchananbacteria bacterium CG10_big_fil_rev_8_21_14_0_10_33_19]